MSFAMAEAMRIYIHAICSFFAVVSGVYAAPPVAIPFEYSEGFLWVQVATPQSDRLLNFIFDTGAEISVINDDTTAKLGLSTGDKIQVQGVQTVTTGRWPVKLSAKAGQVKLPGKYLSLDLSQLSQACKRPLDGLLGADFIRGKIVEIDFVSHLITFREAITRAKSDIELPLKESGACFCLPIQVNDELKQWVRLDTGCATALQWVTAEVGMGMHSTIPAIGLTGMAIPQASTTVSLGERQFENVATGIHKTPIFAGESGLLGNGLLSRFQTVTIDTRSNRLVLSPK